MPATTHRVTIKVEAPQQGGEKSYSRSSVFNIDLETELPLATVQKLANDLFTRLTEEGCKRPVVDTPRKGNGP